MLLLNIVKQKAYSQRRSLKETLRHVSETGDILAKILKRKIW